MWRRCACDTDIERCECANDHALVRHRQMPIRCVYMRERSSSLLCVCVCEFEHVVKYYRPWIHLGIRQ